MAKPAGNAQTPFIPSRFAELSPDFLTRSLRASGVLASGRVQDLRVEVIGAGIGFAGEVARVHLDYADPADAGPPTLIAKLPSADRKNRAALEALYAYEREVCFYQQLSTESKLPVPRCYYAEMDPDPLYAWRPAAQRWLERLPVWLFRALHAVLGLLALLSRRRYLVLLEDLGSAENGDQIEGCDLPRAEQAVRGLAAFHASYWSRDELAEMIWLPRLDTLPRSLMAVHRRSRRRFFRAHCERVPERMRDACRWMDAHFEAVMRQLASPPRSLIHGDYRLDNLFFETGGMWAVDFQVVLLGRPAYDLAYFVVGSVAPDVDEARLLDVYCDELVRRGVTVYDRAECERDYTLSKLFQVYLHVASDDALNLGDDRGPRLLETMRARLLARIPEPPYDALLA